MTVNRPGEKTNFNDGNEEALNICSLFPAHAAHTWTCKYARVTSRQLTGWTLSSWDK